MFEHWRWNRFGTDTWFLDAGGGVRVLAGRDRAEVGEERWRYRAAGARLRRVQLVRTGDDAELLGVSLDWAGAGVIDGTPGWTWERTAPRAARVVGADGAPLLHFERDADPASGATLRVASTLAPRTAIPLATFAWLVDANEAVGTMILGESRGVRALWR